MVDPKRELELRQDVEALYFGYRTFTSLPDRILAERGLGRAHHRILYFVHREPGITVGDLIALLRITKQAIHRPLKELESLGLLTLAPDAHDRRIRRITASTEGAR
ncbi:MAG TPA: helix-turn-helix domain-containing protein, partial [Arachnia sp.]|nr:helix-turn-helix domain-containing protein [Arachnia sp.]